MTTNSNSYRSLPSENLALISPARPEAREMVARSFPSGNHPDAMTGTTDSMILPRSIATVDVAPSSFEIADGSPAIADWGASLSFLGLVACCALFIHQISQKKKSVRSSSGE